MLIATSIIIVSNQYEKSKRITQINKWETKQNIKRERFKYLKNNSIIEKYKLIKEN